MEIPKLKCLKCGHERVIRTENPVKCSRCGHIPGTKIKTKKADATRLASKITPALTNPAPVLLGGNAVG